MSIESKKISVIIRTKDEEKWISSCLKSVFSQTLKNIEVIIVDNNSTDQTVSKASEFPVILTSIDDFKPGKAINVGIRASSGEYLVCLSGHCIPTSESWLERLVQDLALQNVAGVYGRQEPLAFTPDTDKRDLLLMFGLDKKIQVLDTFFHNANSAFRRDVWEKYPFDENITNIEDRLWGRAVIEAGFNIHYEPTASVYHWHGIHHSLNPRRARNIIRIMEKFTPISDYALNRTVNDLNIIAIIPLRGQTKKVVDHTLLECTISSAKASKYIKTVYVSTDNNETAELAKSLGANVPFIRPASLSQDFIDISEVVKYSTLKIEELIGVSDLLVILDETYPFRPAKIIDSMIEHIVKSGLDTLVAAKSENRGIWKQEKDNISKLTDGFVPTPLREETTFVGLAGLCLVTHPMFARTGDIYGTNLGFYEVNEPVSCIQYLPSQQDPLLEIFIKRWFG